MDKSDSMQNRDGILGLGFNSEGPLSVWQNAFRNNHLRGPVIGLWYGRPGAPVKRQMGSLSLGSLDTQRFEGRITYMTRYVPMGDSISESKIRSSWAVHVDAAVVSGTVVPLNHAAVITTGNNGILGPQAAVDAIYAHIPGAWKPQNGNWLIKCEDKDKLDLKFRFGGVDFPIFAQDAYTISDKNICTGRIQAHMFPEWHLGVEFLKNVYTVFRAEPPSVGFAKLKNEWNYRDFH